MLTSLLRTARKQPLLSSEGSNKKKGSVSPGPSAWSKMLNGNGLSLDETHIYTNRIKQYIKIHIEAAAKNRT